MTDRAGRARGVCATVFGLAGLAGAFAAAACCALPTAIAMLGLGGGAWLLDIAIVAGPWQPWLLWGGAAALVLAVGLSAPCRAQACTTARVRGVVLALALPGAALVGFSVLAG
jgi:hypothetical protein